jgi:very-short-patch-repair endonuclease
MPIKHIITNQAVTDQCRVRAVQMRHAMTPAEQKLWQHLRAGRLEGYHFRRQQIIGYYIVDFYCHQADLVIEVDGEIHLEQQEYDADRSAYLAGRGLHILRFTNTEVYNSIDRVLAFILESCTQAGTSHADQVFITC